MTDHVDNPVVQLDSSLSVQEAAERFGVSEKTIRRRIKAGSLLAFQHATSQGFEWRVHLDSHAVQVDGGAVQVGGQVGKQVDSTPIQPASPAAEPALLKTLEMVEQLQRQNLELAGQVGFLQAKLQTAEQRILLLEARPTEDAAVDVVPNDGHDAIQGAQEGGQAPSPVTKPWWQRLFGRP